jgi:hypothetical protein
LEPRRGSREQARDYCKKEDTRLEGPWEHGEWINGPGHRTDIDLIIDCLKEGQSEKEICNLHPNEWARNWKTIDRWSLLNAPRRSERTQLHIFIGDPKSGKSKEMELLSPNGHWKTPGPWFDGYDGKADLILDEADKQEINIGQFLLLADRYPLRVPVKGSFVNFTAKNIYAASNLPVEQWYKKEDDIRIEALLRRIDSKTTFRWVEEGGIKTVKRTQEFYTVDFETTILPPEDHSPQSTIKSPLPTEGGLSVVEDEVYPTETAKACPVPLNLSFPPPNSQSSVVTGNEVRGNTTPEPRSPRRGTNRKSAVRTGIARKKTKS